MICFPKPFPCDACRAQWHLRKSRGPVQARVGHAVLESSSSRPPCGHCPADFLLPARASWDFAFLLPEAQALLAVHSELESSTCSLPAGHFINRRGGYETRVANKSMKQLRNGALFHRLLFDPLTYILYNNNYKELK